MPNGNQRRKPRRKSVDKLPEHVPNLDFVLRMVELNSVMGHPGWEGTWGTRDV